MHLPILLGLIGVDGQPLSLQGATIATESPFELRDGGMSLLLHLRTQKSQLRIGALAQSAEVSFLRGFSAPVRVRYPRTQAALQFLARHDTDGFARWDVLQSLIVEQVFAMAADSAVATPQATVALFADLIDEALVAGADPELQSVLANMLTLPSETYLFEQAGEIDVHGIVSARDRFVQTLADDLQPRWQKLFDRYSDTGSYEPSPLAMAQRQLKNQSLGFLAQTTQADSRRSARTCVQQQLQAADNLTDRRGALAAVLGSSLFDGAERSEMLAEFYDRWSAEALVVNLWLQLQASAPTTDAQAVAELAAHPSFDQRNPNKVRSLVGGFAMHNARNFHARDGSGYRFLAERIVAVDQANPQLAARLALPLSKWRRYVSTLGAPMRSALKSIAAAPELSKDVFEIVSKSLAED